MRIRPYAPSDRALVLDVWLKASKVGHPFLPPEDLLRQQALVGEVYLPNSETWVAEVSGTIVGFIGLLEAFIGGLFVEPTAHGQGVGRRLVEHAYVLKGPLTVDVYAENPIAPAFYERLGFTEVDRKDRDEEGRPFPLIVMRKS